MQIFNTVLVIAFLPLLVVYMWALIKPHHKALEKPLGTHPTRKTIHKNFLPVLAVLFILIGITTPPTIATQNAASQSLQTQQQLEASKAQEAARVQAIESAKPQVKEVTETSGIPYSTESQQDSTRPLGQSATIREGVDGEKTVTYQVTYQDGKETARTKKDEQITKQPISKLVSTGTYVTPVSTNSSGDGYVNSQGHYVPSPSNNPAGATARCNDGTYSYSQNHSGTCSHHGGVANWL
jgi:hypothetical protein